MTGVTITARVNGETTALTGHPMDRLLDALRSAGLTGTKEGCGEGECGACTVVMDGEPVLACLIPLFQCEGRVIETVESLRENAAARDFLDRFIAEGGTQCGACTPGIVLTAWCLAKERASLTEDDVRRALAGNLCRCTGYEGILRGLVAEER